MTLPPETTTIPRKLKIYAWLGLVAMALVTVISALSLPKLQTQYSVMQFLPAHHPALQMDANVRRIFHLTDLPTFIGVVSLGPQEVGTWLEKDRIQKLSETTEKIKNLPGVGEALSIATIDGATDVKGTLSVGPLLETTPQTLWSSRVLEDKLLTPTLIDTKARTVLVYTQLKNANADLLVQFESQFRQTLKEAFPQAEASIGGVPAVQTDLGLLLNKELRNFLVLTILVCALTLFCIFRNVTTMLTPLLLTALSNIAVFGMMAWTGLTFTVLSTTIPVLVFITVVSVAVHTLLRVHEGFEHRGPYDSKWDVIRQANKTILLPNFLGALTTSVGFLTLLVSDVPLIRNYSLSVAAAVMLSWLVTSLGLLPFLILLPSPCPRPWIRRPARWALWAILRRRWIVSGVLAACIGCCIVGRHLEWTGRLFDDLPAGQEARVSTEKIDAALGGVIPLEVVIQAPGQDAWTEPERIRKLDGLLTTLRGLEGVGTAHSLPDFLKALRSEGQPALPEKKQTIAETYFLYSLSTENPLDGFLVSNNRVTRIEMKLHDLPSQQMQDLIRDVQSRVQSTFPDSKVEVGGMGAVVHIIHDELSHELIFGFWQALALIVLMLAFIFRSLRWALVACVPNLVPPIALLGYLALTHTPIKPGVAIIFSIALGLAFNNTVYLLNRIRSMRHENKNTLRTAFYLEGNPCLVSTLIVLTGFSVFLFSYFSLNQTFGACMIVSLMGGLIGDLFFLPALLTWFPFLLGRPTSTKNPSAHLGKSLWRRVTG